MAKLPYGTSRSKAVTSGLLNPGGEDNSVQSVDDENLVFTILADGNSVIENDIEEEIDSPSVQMPIASEQLKILAMVKHNTESVDEDIDNSPFLRAIRKMKSSLRDEVTNAGGRRGLIVFSNTFLILKNGYLSLVVMIAVDK